MPGERARGTGARIRLWALLALLGGTLLYAWHEVRSRRSRTEWARPVQVAVALVQLDSVEPAVVDSLRLRIPALEARLTAEYRRYGGLLERPIAFTVFGPVSVDRAPPNDPDDGIASLALHAYRQWRWTRAIDDAADLPWGRFDSRIYVVVRSPHERSRSLVEGSSELGGRVGVARIELDADTVDLALFVVTHELFHTLGANDEYDADGRTLVPQGLVEPNRVPLYPQRFAEVMTRNLVLAPGQERPPDSLMQLGVGNVTAREIGWSGSVP